MGKTGRVLYCRKWQNSKDHMAVEKEHRTAIGGASDTVLARRQNTVW